MTTLELKAKEFGSKILFTDQMLNGAADDERLKIVQRMLLDVHTRYLVVNGVKVLRLNVDTERDISIRGWEYSLYGEAIPELTLLALVAKQDVYQRNLTQALFRVNRLSWWKFLWLKLRGKDIVSYD